MLWLKWLVFVFPVLRNVGGTCSQLFSLATGQYGMRPVSPVWWWKVCPSVLVQPLASPVAVFGPKHPVTAIHLATPPPGYLYFLLQTFPNAVAVEFLFDRHEWLTVPLFLYLERCDGVRLSVRGDEPQLSGVWGQAAAAQQLGFLGKQTRHQSCTRGYQRHTRSEGQGLFTYPFIISLLLLQLKCLNKKFFDIS